MAFAFTKNPRRIFFFFFVNAIVEFEEWSIASIIQVERFRGGVKTFFVNYRINYQKALWFNEANYERIELTQWLSSDLL